MVQNETGIIVGETHLLLPYMVLSLLAVLQRIDPNLKHAAESLGAPDRLPCSGSVDGAVDPCRAC